MSWAFLTPETFIRYTSIQSRVLPERGHSWFSYARAALEAADTSLDELAGTALHQKWKASYQVNFAKCWLWIRLSILRRWNELRKDILFRILADKSFLFDLHAVGTISAMTTVLELVGLRWFLWWEWRFGSWYNHCFGDLRISRLRTTIQRMIIRSLKQLASKDSSIFSEKATVSYPTIQDQWMAQTIPKAYIVGKSDEKQDAVTVLWLLRQDYCNWEHKGALPLLTMTERLSMLSQYVYPLMRLMMLYAWMPMSAGARAQTECRRPRVRKNSWIPATIIWFLVRILKVEQTSLFRSVLFTMGSSWLTKAGQAIGHQLMTKSRAMQNSLDQPARSGIKQGLQYLCDGKYQHIKHGVEKTMETLSPMKWPTALTVQVLFGDYSRREETPGCCNLRQHRWA